MVPHRTSHLVAMVAGVPFACFWPTPIVAQAPRPLTLRLEWRVEGNVKDLNKIGEVTVGPDGTVAASLPQDNSVRLFSPQGALVGTVGPNGLAPPEFSSVFRMGWKGDTLWAYDSQLRRVSLIRPTGTLIRRALLVFAGKPTMSHNLWLYGVVPVKFLAGDTLIASGWSGEPEGPAPRPTLYLTTLAFKRFDQVTSLPNNKCRVIRASTRAACNVGLHAFSPNGDWLALSEIEGITEDASSFTLRLVSTRGDTAFNRRVMAPGAKPRLSALPTFLHVGSDGTTWVGGVVNGGVRWLAFDAKGASIGTTIIPRNFRMAAVSRSKIWVIETDPNGVESILQLAIGAGR